MGLPFCSPADSQDTSQDTEKRRERTTTHNVIEEEKAILNNVILDLTQKLATQQMENKLLKQELTTLSEQNHQNIQSIQSLQQQLSTSATSPRDDINRAQSFDPMLVPNLQNIARAATVPNGPRMSRTVVDKDGIIEPEKRMHATLQTASTVRDVSKFVTHKYQTVSYELSDEDEDILAVTAQEIAPDINYNDDSSVDAEDLKQINEAKERLNKQKSIDDEMEAVKQEINAIQQQIPDVDIMRGHSLRLETDEIVQRSDDDALPSSNLFRFQSKNSWDPNAVTAHKKDMEAAMAHLLQDHVNTSKSTRY